MAAQTFEEADDLLGFSLSRICFEGPEDTLNETVNTQPALYVCGIAALRALYTLWDDTFQLHLRRAQPGPVDRPHRCWGAEFFPKVSSWSGVAAS